MEQTVELTLQKVGDSDTNKITCTTAGDSGDRTFTCQGSTGSITNPVAVKDTADDTKDTAKIDATLDNTLTETTAFRCTVTVGDGTEDEKAVDTKLIYAQKIRVEYENGDLEKYKMMKTDDNLEISVYGDDAYSLQRTASNCKLGTSGDKKTFDTTNSVTVTHSAKLDQLSITCSLKFNTKTNTPETLDYTHTETSEKIVAECTTGQYWHKTENACKDCPENHYKETGDSQFEDCWTCAAGSQPNEERTSCVPCPPGKYSTAISVCEDCPKGTASESPGATECTPCSAGHHTDDREGQTTCNKCLEGMFSPGLGSAQCTQCLAGTFSDETGSTSCKLCDAGKVSKSAGLDDCESCPDGHYSTPGSASCTPCPEGTISNGDYSGCATCEKGSEYDANNKECKACASGYVSPGGGASCTECPAGTKSSPDKSSCEPCSKGEYQPDSGKETCLSCQEAGQKLYSAEKGSKECIICRGTLKNNVCTECAINQKVVSNECESCDIGETSTAGSESCQKCPPGTKKGEGDDGCVPCLAGEKQPLAGQKECVSCDADKGEFQTERGQTYCKTTKPGYQLNDGDKTKEEVKCEKNSYSTGGAKKCTPCDSSKAEYTEADGSTYCNICMGLVDEDGDCGATNCDEDLELELKGVGDEKFTFPVVKVGSTAEVKCEAENAEKSEDVITRYCSYNSATRKGEWATADSSKCSSQFTDMVLKQVDAVKEIDITDTAKTAEAVKNITDLAKSASEMAPQDLSNMANTVSEVAAKFEAAEDIKVDAAEAEGLASTVGNVAGAGEAKLASVTESEKTKMVNTVNIIAKNLNGAEPVQTETIAMQKFSKIEVAAPVELPKPKNGTTSSPKLTMKKAAVAGDKEVAPSVAVFDKETAKAIFPKPTASSSSNSNTDTTESTGSKTLKVNYTIDSSIVSLEFAGTTELDIEIEIPVDTSEDSGKSGYELTRTCKFYNDSKEEWSEDGCKTVVGELSSTTGERSYTCQCTHNTSFAIILSQAEIADTIQTTASTILNTVNIIFLGLTFICIAPFKKFRARRLIQIQVQLCAALFVGHIAFIILGTTTASSKSCVPGVIIVQYLFLVAVAWSVCASVTLYEKIVNALKSFGKQDKHYFLKCLAGCWTAPLFMVIATYVTTLAMDEKTLPYVTSTGELDDEKTETCWVASPWKWVGFIIPVYLCLGINVVLFVMIARIIIKAGKSGSSTGHAREVKAIMSIATTVCLPWLVALLMTGPPTMAQIFQWIFIIVTSMQGPTMFICFVIFQEDVLTNLFSLIGKEPPQALLPAKSSKSTKSAASEISSIKPTTAAPVKKEEKSDVVQVKNPEYSTPVQQAHHSEENIYSKVDEEAPAEKDDTISRGSRGSKHLYESTSYTQHGDKGDDINPVPAVEQGETYENAAANDLDIAQNTYPHVPQLV